MSKPYEAVSIKFCWRVGVDDGATTLFFDLESDAKKCVEALNNAFRAGVASRDKVERGLIDACEAVVYEMGNRSAAVVGTNLNSAINRMLAAVAYARGNQP